MLAGKTTETWQPDALGGCQRSVWSFSIRLHYTTQERIPDATLNTDSGQGAYSCWKVYLCLGRDHANPLLVTTTFAVVSDVRLPSPDGRPALLDGRLPLLVVTE